MSGTHRYASTSAARRERVVGVAFGLLGLTLARSPRGRASSAPAHRYQPVVAATASSAQRRAAIRSPRASAASRSE